MDLLLLVYQVCVSQYTAALYNAPRYIIYISSQSQARARVEQQLCRNCVRLHAAVLLLLSSVP